MKKIATVFCTTLPIKELGYPNAQISPAKSSSLVDIAHYASSRFAFFGRNLSVCLSHYY